MKNIFKFMGIALMASSLLIACGKDDEEGTDGGNTAQITVNYDGTTWNATRFAAFVGVDNNQNQLLVSYIYKDYEDFDAPFIFGQLGAEVGAYSLGQSDRYHWVMYLRNDDDYFIPTGESDEQPVLQPYTCVMNITAVDLDALTISGEINAQMVDAQAYEETQEMNLTNLNVALKNAEWEVIER